MNKKKRKEVFNKCHGHCAYCGCEISFSDFQVDHKISKRESSFLVNFENPEKKFEVGSITNLLPSCSVCNHYKRALELETFRNEWLGKLHTRIKRIPKNPRTEKGRKRKEYMQRILDRYGITEDKPFDKVFYFERIGCK